MKYLIQLILFLIVLLASVRAKKQLEKVLETGIYNFGLIYKIKPLTGEKAINMARFYMKLSKIAPLITALLILLYNFLD